MIRSVVGDCMFWRTYFLL